MTTKQSNRLDMAKTLQQFFSVEQAKYKAIILLKQELQSWISSSIIWIL